jgi:hypothetical protein
MARLYISLLSLKNWAKGNRYLLRDCTGDDFRFWGIIPIVFAWPCKTLFGALVKYLLLFPLVLMVVALIYLFRFLPAFLFVVRIKR